MKPPHVSTSSATARLPRRAASEGSPVGTFAPSVFANVLIIDRDPATRHTLGEWFAARHHFVAFAAGHTDADVTLATMHFDLIVCDSGASSHAARRWIERLFKHPPCPVIFVTTHPTLDSAIRIANLPFAGYLAKPIDLAALGRLVDRSFATAHPSTS